VYSIKVVVDRKRSDTRSSAGERVELQIRGGLMMAKGKFIEIDVREDLKNKFEPFQKIMKAVQSLEEGDTLILHTPFKPKPLITLLKAKGFTWEAEQKEAAHWVTSFTKKKKGRSFFSFFKKKKKEATGLGVADDSISKDVVLSESVEKDLEKAGSLYRLDNRGLQPPQPMMRTLHQLTRMDAGETLIIINERIPVFLFEELQQLGYEYSYEEVEDKHVEITIIKKKYSLE
jgi:uncharacterized protein (DUF2249 family)